MAAGTGGPKDFKLLDLNRAWGNDNGEITEMSLIKKHAKKKKKGLHMLSAELQTESLCTFFEDLQKLLHIFQDIQAF